MVGCLEVSRNAVGEAHVACGDSQLQAEPELLDELQRAIQKLAQMGETGTRATVAALHADVLARLGRDDEAERRAEESRAISGADDLDAQPRWRAAMARVLVRRGDLEGAEQLAREAVALLEPLDFIGLQADAFDALGEVLEQAGRADEAVDALERALALHERKGNIVSAERCRSLLNELGASRT